MPTGTCFCGNLKYEYTGEPVWKGLCHCISCHKITGSPFSATMMVPDSNFHFTHGTPKTTTQSHEVGMPLELFFCGDCGSPMAKKAHADAFAGHYIVFAGTVDGNDKFDIGKPENELWTKYRADWLGEINGAKQHETFT